MAAVHSFTESLCVQLAETTVSVIKVAPPGVRITMFGQENAEQATPSDDILDAALGLLHAEAPRKDVIVNNAKFVRYSQADGTYDSVLNRLPGRRSSKAQFGAFLALKRSAQKRGAAGTSKPLSGSRYHVHARGQTALHGLAI